jgi:hypothetical protein
VPLPGFPSVTSQLSGGKRFPGLRLFGSAGHDWLMSRKRSVQLHTASGADLAALVPRAREPEGIDPETLAVMERAADAVVASAPPISPAVRARVRELLTVAAGLHQGNAACVRRADDRDAGAVFPGHDQGVQEGSVQARTSKAS